MRFVLLFLFFLVPFGSIAQQIRYLDIEDGLNGRHAFNFQQDKKGFIWISTRFGIDRYDGKNIKNYSLDVIDDQNYAVRMFKVLIDRDSVLWAYTDRGAIYRYNQSRDEFELHKNLSQYLRTLNFDHLNRIWVGSKSNLGVIGNDSLINLDIPRLRGMEIQAISNYNDHNLLIATDKDVFIFHPETKELVSIFNTYPNYSKKIGTIESVYFDDALNQIWIGSVHSGVSMYDAEKNQFLTIEDPLLMKNPILTLLPVDSKYMFVGTDGTGAWLLDKQTLQIVQSFREQEGLELPLSGDGVYDIFRDREGRIWISTYADGVNIIDFGRRGFQIMRHERNNQNSLSRDQVDAILEDSQGRMWFGTNNGINLLDRNTGKWEQLLESENVLFMYEDSRKNIWVGTHASGVFVVNQNGDILHHHISRPDVENSLSTNFIYAILEDSNGDMWIGGKKGATSKYNRSTNTFSQIGVSQANYFMEKDQNHLLLAGETGVFVMNLFTGHYYPATFSNSLKSRFISDMYVESDSIVWLASFGDGLNRCNFYTGEVQSFNSENGLLSDFVYAILDDDSGNIWFSTEKGLGVINKENYSMTNFFAGDGISDSPYKQLSRVKNRDGELFFGSHTGVTHFYPDQITPQDVKAKIVLLDFSLFNRVVKPGDDLSPLEKALDETHEIQLNNKQHSFSLNFTTIDFSAGGERKFRWKLEGLDDEWIGPISDNIINYTNLSPNKYTLRLQSLGNNNEIHNERTLSILIKPPFWETAWARLTAVILAIIMIYWIYLYITHAIEKRQSEAKIRFFINSTHDIRTPLILISAPIFELKERMLPDARNNYLLDLVTTNLDKLNKMFSQLLDFQKIYESNEQLVVRKRNTNNFLSEKVMYWKPVAEKKDIDLTLELPDTIVHGWFDSEKMDKIMDNLIYNALKYTPVHGRVGVSLKSEAGFWQISVTDTGIGIPQSDKRNLFRRFFRAQNAINTQETGTGLGLLLVNNYVKLHGGELGVNSEENVGSEFFIRFPHGTRHFKNSVMLDNARLPIVQEDALPQSVTDNNKIKVKILLVEDNKDLREYLKMSLSHHYKVYDAENGLLAWNKVAEVNPDIIVSDLQMPEMNGFELCRKVKTTFETSHIPFILLTVMTDEKNLEEGLKTGADDYLPKPLDPKFLRIKIDNIINNRKILRKKFLDFDKSSPQETDLENTLNLEFIQKATKIAEERHMDYDFSISDFTKEMGLSRSLLYTKFHTITGYTPNDFIKVFRMKKAIELFREKKYMINEVASMTGFSEPAYFATCFKKIYGKTPRQFIEDDIS